MVASLVTIKNRNPFRRTFQCAGICPTHSTPESFIGTLGSSPLVTAWLMRAVRFS